MADGHPDQSIDSILYQSPEKSLFIVDIPASIASAQSLLLAPGASLRYLEIPASELASSSSPAPRRIFSSSPAILPYPSLEPRSSNARARVLDRIPAEQVKYLETLSHVATDALHQLKSVYDGKWCGQRALETQSQEAVDRKQSQQNKSKRIAVVNGKLEPNWGLKSHLGEIHSASSGMIGSYNEPPFLLGSGITRVSAISNVSGVVVRNPWDKHVVLWIGTEGDTKRGEEMDNETRDFKRQRVHCSSDSTCTGSSQQNPYIHVMIPPKASFMLTQTSSSTAIGNPIPPLPPSTKFDFILMDPPWANRSVRRSRHYTTYSNSTELTVLLSRILLTHLSYQGGIAAIWVTNSAESRAVAHHAMASAGLRPLEEWVWIKTTTKGEPISVIDGVWRKSYEILLLGIKWDRSGSGEGTERSTGKGVLVNPEPYKSNETWYEWNRCKRRIIAAVPDIHSRKPNLKEIIERVFFTEEKHGYDHGATEGNDTEGTLRVKEYTALEVFARNLTAGWWACGNEVLRFNWVGWWEGFDEAA